MTFCDISFFPFTAYRRVGNQAVADLPDAWAEAYEKTLGVAPSDDAEGSLQDGHWAAGMFGYFPTYALGNVVAAQLFAAAKAARPGLEGAIERGDFAPLISWLRENVHAHGSTLPLVARVERAAGAPPDVAAYAAYLDERYPAR